jgi:hypothetical protein
MIDIGIERARGAGIAATVAVERKARANALVH